MSKKYILILLTGGIFIVIFITTRLTDKKECNLLEEQTQGEPADRKRNKDVKQKEISFYINRRNSDCNTVYNHDDYKQKEG